MDNETILLYQKMSKKYVYNLGMAMRTREKYMYSDTHLPFLNLEIFLSTQMLHFHSLLVSFEYPR